MAGVLTEIVNSMREQAPHLSWEALGVKCGVQGKTLKNISEGKIDKPLFSTALGICLYHFRDHIEDARTTLISMFPKKEKLVGRHLEVIEKNKLIYKTKDLSVALSNRYKWNVFSTLADRNEISLSYFENQGIKYISAALELEKEGLIEISNKTARAVHRNFSLDSAGDRLQVAEYFLENVKDRRILNQVDPNSCLGLQFGGLNSSGIEALYSLYVDLWEKITGIYAKKEFEGNISHGTMVLTSKYDIPISEEDID
jgi:hypothetical protein